MPKLWALHRVICNLFQKFERHKQKSPIQLPKSEHSVYLAKHKNKITALLKNIARYLNEAKRQHSLATDAALSQELGVPPNHIFNWYNDVSHLNDEAAVKLARLLRIDPLEIIACANYHKVAKSTKRKRNPKKNTAQRKFWRQVYNKAIRKK